MKRRNFLQLMAATGMTAHMPLWSPKAHAASALDKYLVVVNASGGWDPTSLCDPKGLNQAYPDQSNRHEGSTNSVEIDPTKQIGDIRWSAVPETASNNVDVLTRITEQFDGFFTTYANRMTVINGIDTGTNNHDSGNRAIWSGNLDAGYPSISAYYAATVAPNLPMAFISNGGYDFTDSLVPRARASNADFIDQLADPNKYYNDIGFLYRDSTRTINQYDRVKEARAARLARQIENETLPLRRKQLSQLFGIRSEESNLGQLSVHLDDIKANVIPDENWHENRSDSLKNQAQVVVAAFKSNLAASANLNIGGFDTHGNHDSSAYPQLGDLLEGVHYLMAALEFAGIANKTTVVIGSDFGRTPYYNSGNGKDHWPVTSMMVIHPTATGGRVFGASTSDFNSQTINLQTGIAGTGANDLILTPEHVNYSLRTLLGVNNNVLAESYPLASDAFNIFA